LLGRAGDVAGLAADLPRGQSRYRRRADRASEGGVQRASSADCEQADY
jgi:hypothetical protein